MKSLSLPIPRLMIATHNSGKLREFAALLAPYAGEISAAGALGLPEPEETGQSFTDNAILKARAAATGAACVALADDSGLCVTALGGAPGIYSARWAGPGKDFTAAMRRVHEEMGSAADRSAFFVCVLALAAPDGALELFEGRVDGQIVWPPRGTGGHGYDPIFMPAGYTQTFAEMDEVEKNGISHRGAAVQKMMRWLEIRGTGDREQGAD
jgi:XTP/dITP diphosphohydrolase